MHHCVDCARLTDIYTNLTRKFRIAVGAAVGQVTVSELDELRDASLEARITLQQHQLKHIHVCHQETTPPAAYFQRGVIVWPSGNDEHDTALKPFRASAQTNVFLDQ